MPVFDVRNMVRVPNQLLAETENPRHRRILMNFRRHALFEVAGRWKEILTPEMMVAEPIYRINEPGRSLRLVGLSEIATFYASLADRGLTVFGPIEEVMAVADWGLAIESFFGHHIPGRILAEQGDDIDDLDAFYQVTHYVSSFWPYDENCLLMGEHIYEDGTSRTIEKMDPADVITPARAAELLAPIIEDSPLG
jgi:hypothetical protein